MVGARIVLFEDNPTLQVGIKMILEAEGHSVKATEATRARALALLDDINRQKLACEVIVSDGHLDGRRDGLVIIERARQLLLPQLVILCSSDQDLLRESPADFNVLKEDMVGLCDIIAEYMPNAS